MNIVIKVNLFICCDIIESIDLFCTVNIININIYITLKKIVIK